MFTTEGTDPHRGFYFNAVPFVVNNNYMLWREKEGNGSNPKDYSI